jgi:hypothetical protein
MLDAGRNVKLWLSLGARDWLKQPATCPSKGKALTK